MTTLLIMYGQPVDPAAFDAYYFSTHVPIFSHAPGMRSVSFSTGPILPIAGDSAYYLIATVGFDSMADLQAALASPAVQAAIADLPNFASGGVSIVAYDERG